MVDQKFTRIKGLSDIRRLPRLGKIRLGVKAIAKNGKEYPREVPYFVVPPEVEKVYGDRPLQLDIMFPTEDDRAIFPQSYKWYVSNGLRCKGNGETAMRRFADMAKGDRQPLSNGAEAHKPDELVEVACPCPLLETGECRQNANLMVLLPKVSLGGVYQITTGSFHNIVRVNSCIDYVRGIVGRIALVPLLLIRQEEEIQYEGKKAKHYLLQVILNINLEEAGKLRDNARMILAQTERLSLPAPIEDGDDPDGSAPILVDESKPHGVDQIDEAVKAMQKVGLVDGPLEITVETMDMLKESITLEQLAAAWQEIVNRETGIWKTLPEADKQSLMLVKNRCKAAIEEAIENPL